MKRSFFLLFLFSFFAFSGCFDSDEDGEIVTPEETNLQEMTIGKFVIGKPPEWDMVLRTQTPEKLPANVLFLLSSIEPWGQGDKFATVALAQEKLPVGTSARKYNEAAEQKTAQSMVDYDLISEEKMELNSIPAKLIRFRARQSLDGDMFEWMHLFILHDEYGYILSSTTPVDATQEHKALLSQIMHSFRFAQ